MSYYGQGMEKIREGLVAIANEIKSRPAPVTYNVIVNLQSDLSADEVSAKVQQTIKNVEARRGRGTA